MESSLNKLHDVEHLGGKVEQLRSENELLRYWVFPMLFYLILNFYLEKGFYSGISKYYINVWHIQSVFMYLLTVFLFVFFVCFVLFLFFVLFVFCVFFNTG